MIQLGYKTWRYLGLSVALGYAGLGLFEIAAPAQAAKYFFGWNTPSRGAAEKKEDTPTAREQAATIETVLPLMGARDLTLFTALMIFFHTRQHSEMGVVILSGMVLCAADVAAIWKWRGPLLGSQFLAGALSWGFIGYGLYREDF